MGEADGSIIPVIMTAHIAQSSSKCGISHRAVIIHALAPVIGPYMSRAITTIQIHETSGSSTSSTTTGVRSYRKADSRIVRGRSATSRKIYHRPINIRKHLNCQARNPAVDDFPVAMNPSNDQGPG